jgi:hypothetical protein
MRMARPQMPSSGDIRPLTAGEVNGRPLDELSALPSSPAYRSKLPPPPCSKCGEDHIPGRTYGHNWEPEPVPAALPTYEVESHEDQFRLWQATQSPQPPAPIDQRVGLYIGRNGKYIIIVERAPDWDGFESFKVDEEYVVPMIRLVRALGIRVSDKTGGDLAALESDASEST